MRAKTEYSVIDTLAKDTFINPQLTFKLQRSNTFDLSFYM